MANYQLNRKTQLRLIATKRSTDVVSSIFTPVDSAVSTEEQTLPLGLPRDLRTVEFDIERYLSSSSFLKLFLFRSTADATSFNLSTFSNPSTANGVSSALVMTNVERVGLGARLEKQLSGNLFGQALFVSNRSKGTTRSVTGANEKLPYHPEYQALLGLNYVDKSGLKAGLQINRVGSFFQDTGLIGAPGAPRPTFPAKTYMDLTLAKEPSVRSEVS